MTSIQFVKQGGKLALLRQFAATGPADDREYLRYLRMVRTGEAMLRRGELPDGEASVAPYALTLLRSGLKLYELLRGDHLRKGNWSQTHSGRRFWIQDPHSDECDVRDIAHGLSRIARFYGATLGTPYSVAQHCMLGSYFCPGHELAFLLHDASEAYIGDVASHVKRVIGDDYMDIEAGIMDAVNEAFGVGWNEEDVEETDARMLATEVDQLLSYGVINNDDMADPLPIRIEPWPAATASEVFLNRFAELTGAKETQ